MGFPTVTVEAAFTTDPGDTPVWEDITEWLLEFSVNRGRRDEFSRFPAGSAQIILANEDRRFDPTHTTGPYYPNVLPMRRIRIRATYAAVTYDVFNGYADGWQQTYRPPSVATCTLTVSDAFKVLAGIDLPASVYAAEVLADNPLHWWRLGDSGVPFLDSIGTAHMELVGASEPTAGTPGLVVRDSDTAVTFTLAGNETLQSTENAAPTGTGDFSVELIFTSPVAPVADGVLTSMRTPGATGHEDLVVNAAGRVYNSGNGIGGGVSSTTTSNNDGDPHHVVLVRSAGTRRIYIDGVDVTITPTTDSTDLPAGMVRFATAGNSFGGVLDEVAIYPTALSPARIAAHASARAVAWSGELSGARVNRILDAAGWPAADRDIDSGVARLQGADLNTSALNALQKVEETERGRVFVTTAGLVRFVSRESLIKAPYATPQATFGDSGAELEYADLSYRYDDQTIYNEARVSRTGGTAQTVRNPASEARFLRRSLVIEGLLHRDDVTSVDLGNWMLAHYAEPILRATDVRLEPDAGNETTHYPQVLGRELVDRVTVLRRPQSVGAAINQETHIEGVRHRVAGLTWKTDWNLSPADTQAYGVWDEPTALWDDARWSF